MTQSLEFSLAQLRHAYAHLKAGRVIRQEEFADGLIAPAIETLETVQTLIDELRLELESARANARHYVGLALEIQNHKDIA